MFYVYEWFIKTTGEIIYVGKGCKSRYKSLCHRNKIFLEFIKRFDCDSRIIKTFETEEEAFLYEKERILQLKSKGLCVCNLDNGGTGGVNFVWTDEMRQYKSKYNPMKSINQRQRMSEKNPMKNPSVAQKIAQKNRRKVVINNIVYDGVKIASQSLNVCEYSVITWCKRGYDTHGFPCRYLDQPQKEYPLIKKTHPMATKLRPVIIDGIRYETVKDGANAINVCSESLIRAIKNGKKCKGHECRYDNQQPSHENSEISIVEGSTTNE